MSKTRFVSEDALVRLLESIGGRDVYAAVRRERSPEYCHIETIRDADMAWREPRPASSPKAFLQPAIERVAVYTNRGVDEAESAPAGKARALVGLRACDLVAIAYLDKVFLEGECADPFYEARRRNELVISADCVAVHENCFCTAVGGRPFAESGFDLNVTALASGYLVDVGTAAGQELMDGLGAAAAEPTEAQLRERQEARAESVEQIEAQTQGLKVSDRVQEALLAKQDSKDLSEMATRCVECAACTFICPTCHCFYLYDQVGGDEKFERIRTWDSCILGDYSRMAGPAGAKPSPRPSLRNRCANRLLHKYAFSPQQYGMLGCTGCGRCIEACYGGIDIREVLRELSGDTSR